MVPGIGPIESADKFEIRSSELGNVNCEKGLLTPACHTHSCEGLPGHMGATPPPLDPAPPPLACRLRVQEGEGVLFPRPPPLREGIGWGRGALHGGGPHAKGGACCPSIRVDPRRVARRTSMLCAGKESGRNLDGARTEKELSTFLLARKEHGEVVEFLYADVEMMMMVTTATTTLMGRWRQE